MIGNKFQTPEENVSLEVLIKWSSTRNGNQINSFIHYLPVVFWVVMSRMMDRINPCRVEGISIKKSRWRRWRRRWWWLLGWWWWSRLGLLLSRRRSPLIPEFLLPSPLGPSITKPNLNPSFRKPNFPSQSLSGKYVWIVGPFEFWKRGLRGRNYKSEVVISDDDELLQTQNVSILPFSKLSICSFVKEVRFRWSFRLSRSLAWSSTGAGLSEATLLLSPHGLPLSESAPERDDSNQLLQ